VSLEENKAAVRRIFAALDDQDLDAVAALLAADYRLHFDGNPEMDRAAGIGFFGAFLAAFPNITHQVQDQIAEGDRVARRIVERGTHEKELMGIPATGNARCPSARPTSSVSTRARSPSIGSTRMGSA
jgi:predicted ester cyclase